MNSKKCAVMREKLYHYGTMHKINYASVTVEYGHTLVNFICVLIYRLSPAFKIKAEVLLLPKYLGRSGRLSLIDLISRRMANSNSDGAERYSDSEP